jgi:protein required for attachment to host cells
MENKWVLVADGERAKILVKDGASLLHVHPTYHADEVEVTKNKETHKPGRIRQTSKFNEHVYAPHVHWHEFKKEIFIKKIAKILNEAYTSFAKLVVIAPPQVLGELRKKLNEHVLGKVTLEIPKDLTKFPLEEIKEYI